MYLPFNTTNSYIVETAKCWNREKYRNGKRNASNIYSIDLHDRLIDKWGNRKPAPPQLLAAREHLPIPMIGIFPVGSQFFFCYSHESFDFLKDKKKEASVNALCSLFRSYIRVVAFKWSKLIAWFNFTQPEMHYEIIRFKDFLTIFWQILKKPSLISNI